ncbi:MAG: hypothetical protein Q8N77_00860 [Nanoarchaeota archaeon]|nr:hypothetical protein [Nanoarchaeota archaeon]
MMKGFKSWNLLKVGMVKNKNDSAKEDKDYSGMFIPAGIMISMGLGFLSFALIKMLKRC